MKIAIGLVGENGSGKGTFVELLKPVLISKSLIGHIKFPDVTVETLRLCTNPIIVLDGVRWPSDVEMLRSLPNNILVYVTADQKLRFERLKARKEKVGEGKMDYDQFLTEEQAETEVYIPKIGKTADWEIRNKGTTKRFGEEVANFFSAKLLPLLRKEGIDITKVM